MTELQSCMTWMASIPRADSHCRGQDVMLKYTVIEEGVSLAWVRGSSPLCILSSGCDHQGSASEGWLEMFRNRAALA